MLAVGGVAFLLFCDSFVVIMSQTAVLFGALIWASWRGRLELGLDLERAGALHDGPDLDHLHLVPRHGAVVGARSLHVAIR
jgi:hypothetical protein